MATTNQITHHDINKSVSLEFKVKRVEWLRRKQQPQTALERQRAFYYLLLAVAVLCEVFDAILTFSGIIHFASTRLSENAYFLFWLIGLSVVLLGIFKHKTMDIFHAQRLDDGYVPKTTYVFMIVFFLISAGATYNVTAPALEYLTKTPTLLSVDSVSIRYDSLLAADLVVIAKEIDTHGSTAKAIHKASSWNGKLDMNSQTKYENALGNKNQATAKKTAVVLARGAEKEAAINLVVSKNEATVQKHKNWCVSFGFFLAVLFIVIEVILYPAKWYCKDYEKKEVIEADAKLAAKGQSNAPIARSDIHTPTHQNSTAKVKGKRSQVFANAGLSHGIQIPQGVQDLGAKEGDIVAAEGNRRAKVWVSVSGVLSLRTKGQLRTLMGAQGNLESDRAKYILELINKLP